MVNRNASEEDAYRQACDEYHAIRARTETAQRIAEEEALHHGAQPAISWTEIGLNKEEEALNSSRDILRAREEVYARVCACVAAGPRESGSC